MFTIDYIPAQTLEWFRFGNIFTGSVGDFRYRIAPIKADDVLLASVYSLYSYKNAKDKEEVTFPFTAEGIEQARAWILDKLNSDS